MSRFRKRRDLADRRLGFASVQHIEDSDTFKAQIVDDDDELQIAEEIKSIVLNYLRGQDGIKLPTKLQEEGDYL